MDEAEPGETAGFVVSGPSYTEGSDTTLTLIHTVREDEPATGRAEAAGLMLNAEGDRLLMDEPMFGTEFQTKLQGFAFYGETPVEVTNLQHPAQRMPKQLFWLPALLLLGLVVMAQRRRQTKPAF